MRAASVGAAVHIGGEQLASSGRASSGHSTGREDEFKAVAVAVSGRLLNDAYGIVLQGCVLYKAVCSLSDGDVCYRAML